MCASFTPTRKGGGVWGGQVLAILKGGTKGFGLVLRQVFEVCEDSKADLERVNTFWKVL